MPSNYTGNDAATEPPASPPAFATAPIIALPVDADPRNSASIYQAFKVCADYIAWLINRIVIWAGTISMKALVVDGVGGQPVTPVAGTISAHDIAATATISAGSTITAGTALTAGTLVSAGTVSVAPHFQGVGSAPGVAVNTAYAGLGATASVTGTDASGEVTLNTGTGTNSNGDLFTITFAVPYSVAPKAVLITPASGTAANLSTGQVVFVVPANISASSFKLSIDTVQLTASSVYKWYYLVL